MAGQMAGKRALACASWSINCYHEVTLGPLPGSFFRGHPRFLVLCPALLLERLLKNRLPLVLVRPAAVKAGRLLLAGLALPREEAGLGFAVPVRLVQDWAVGFAGRWEPVPFAVRSWDGAA